MIIVWQPDTDPDHYEPATRLRASSPAADQLVLGDAVLGEKTLRAVVLDRVGQHPARLLGQVRQRRHPQYAHHVLSGDLHGSPALCLAVFQGLDRTEQAAEAGDRKSTRLNSSHVEISYAVFCLKKKKTIH